MTHSEPIYSQTDVAEMLGITPSCFHHRMRLGKYPQPTHVREGRVTPRYTAEAVNEILQVDELRRRQPRLQHVPYDYVVWCLNQSVL